MLRKKHQRYQRLNNITNGTLLFEMIFLGNISPLARARKTKDHSWKDVKKKIR